MEKQNSPGCLLEHLESSGNDERGNFMQVICKKKQNFMCVFFQTATAFYGAGLQALRSNHGMLGVFLEQILAKAVDVSYS